MIKPDIKQLIRDTIYLSRLTHEQLGAMLGDPAEGGLSNYAVDRALARQKQDNGITVASVRMLEAMGYDIEVKLIKRKDGTK